MGFIFACWAIIIITTLMMIIFVADRKKNYAIAIIPLLFLPFMHLISGQIGIRLERIIPLSKIEIHIALDIIAGLISCLSLGFASRKIEGKNARRAFFGFCAFYTIALNIALVINLLT